MSWGIEGLQYDEGRLGYINAKRKLLLRKAKSNILETHRKIVKWLSETTATYCKGKK